MIDAPTADDRERRLIDALVSLAKSFREERDRLSQRLAGSSTRRRARIRLDAHQRAFDEIVVPPLHRAIPVECRRDQRGPGCQACAEFGIRRQRSSLAVSSSTSRRPATSAVSPSRA